MSTSAEAYDRLRMERLHTAPPDPPSRASTTPPEVDAFQRATIRKIVHLLNDALTRRSPA